MIGPGRRVHVVITTEVNSCNKWMENSCSKEMANRLTERSSVVARQSEKNIELLCRGMSFKAQGCSVNGAFFWPKIT